MEIINQWESEIIFWVATGLTAVGGTGISIGALLKWIKGVVEQLFAGKTEYEGGLTKLNSAIEKIEEVSQNFIDASSELSEVKTQLEESIKENAYLKTKIDGIAKALEVLVLNNDKFVADGTADEIKEALGLVEESVTQVEINE